MESVNFVILGDQEIANDFGKKGTSTDLTLFDRKESEKIYTFVTPNGFPEKIQPLFQAIGLAEYVIFHVNTLDKYTGEQILALDALGKKEGILSHSYDVDEGRLDLMIKGTVLEGYKKVEQDKIKEELTNFAVAKKDGSTSAAADYITAAQTITITGVDDPIRDELVNSEVAVAINKTGRAIGALGWNTLVIGSHTFRCICTGATDRRHTRGWWVSAAHARKAGVVTITDITIRTTTLTIGHAVLQAEATRLA